jgi:REP element-mobilizing transposase RayT
MPRKPRIEFEGAFYHVITRGNQRQKIFKEPADYNKFLQFLLIYRNRYHYHLNAFVLMSNHVHLLIETGETPLSKILQGINQSYTLYFNRKYKTVGHLFQGRYKAILCDRESYLLGLLKYIHENPLRARIAETLDVYPWSSHHAYTGKNNPLALVSEDQVLRMFSENKSRARRKYREFMEANATIKKTEVYATIDQRIQGDELFVETVASKVESAVKKELKKKDRSLAQIGSQVQQQNSVSLDQLRSSSKEGTVMKARRVFSQAAKRYGYQGKEIAEYLRKDPASVTGYLQGEQYGREIDGILSQLNTGKQNVNSKV